MPGVSPELYQSMTSISYFRLNCLKTKPFKEAPPPPQLPLHTSGTTRPFLLFYVVCNHLSHIWFRFLCWLFIGLGYLLCAIEFAKFWNWSRLHWTHFMENRKWWTRWHQSQGKKILFALFLLISSYYSRFSLGVNSHLIMTGVVVNYLLGDKNCGVVSLRQRKSKNATYNKILVAFRVRNQWEET